MSIHRIGIALAIAAMVALIGCGGGGGGDSGSGGGSGDGGNSKAESGGSKADGGGSGKTTGSSSNVDGNSVKIGDLKWTKRNLNVETPDSWCYNDSPDSCAKYGRLYTWEAAKQACQSMGGKWRLPTRGDWGNLIGHAGGKQVAGQKLKSESGWSNCHEGKYVTKCVPNGNGTDDYGFSAMPGGQRYSSDSSFSDAGIIGFWWSASEGSNGYGPSGYVYLHLIEYKSNDAFEDAYPKNYGFSVRCVAQ